MHFLTPVRQSRSIRYGLHYLSAGRALFLASGPSVISANFGVPSRARGHGSPRSRANVNPGTVCVRDVYGSVRCKVLFFFGRIEDAGFLPPSSWMIGEGFVSSL